MLNSLMYKLSYYRSGFAVKFCGLYMEITFFGLFDFLIIWPVYYRFVETDGKAFDRVRRTEIGKKYFKLTHFEEVS